MLLRTTLRPYHSLTSRPESTAKNLKPSALSAHKNRMMKKPLRLAQLLLLRTRIFSTHNQTSSYKSSAQPSTPASFTTPLSTQHSPPSSSTIHAHARSGHRILLSSQPSSRLPLPPTPLQTKNPHIPRVARATISLSSLSFDPP
jgi:hypothetical protein